MIELLRNAVHIVIVYLIDRRFSCEYWPCTQAPDHFWN